MLRISSILYLEHVWTRPLEIAKAGIVEQADNASPEQAIAIATADQDKAVGSYGSTSDDNLVSSSSTSLPHQEIILAAAVNEEAQQNDEEEEAAAEIASTSTPPGTMGELSSSNSSIRTTNDSGDQTNSLLVNTMDLPRSETPLTQHNEEDDQLVSSPENFAATSTPKKLANGREFYDDDIGIDDEDDDFNVQQQQQSPITSMNRDKELPSPPSTPTSSKFSPKRIIHRAKSSIHDDSVVRNIGKRTSLFLEKLNHHNQSSTPPPPLPTSPISYATKNSSRINSGSSANSNGNAGNNINNIKEDLAKGLKRRSSKLTIKSKILTKSIRKVLSFHQSQQQQQVVL